MPAGESGTMRCNEVSFSVLGVVGTATNDCTGTWGSFAVSLTRAPSLVPSPAPSPVPTELPTTEDTATVTVAMTIAGMAAAATAADVEALKSTVASTVCSVGGGILSSEAGVATCSVTGVQVTSLASGTVPPDQQPASSLQASRPPFKAAVAVTTIAQPNLAAGESARDSARGLSWPPRTPSKEAGVAPTGRALALLNEAASWEAPRTSAARPPAGKELLASRRLAYSWALSFEASTPLSALAAGSGSGDAAALSEAVTGVLASDAFESSAQANLGVQSLSVDVSSIGAVAATRGPSLSPTMLPTPRPSSQPTREPTHSPTPATKHPTKLPTKRPSRLPTTRPSHAPTHRPSAPTRPPTAAPSREPTAAPSEMKPPTPVPTVDLSAMALYVWGAILLVACSVGYSVYKCFHDACEDEDALDGQEDARGGARERRNLERREADRRLREAMTAAGAGPPQMTPREAAIDSLKLSIVAMPYSKTRAGTKAKLGDNVGGKGGEDAEEDEVCSICLCELEATEPCKELRCFHCFHADCLDEWLNVNPVCPLCKARARPLRAEDLRNPARQPQAPRAPSSVPSSVPASVPTPGPVYGAPPPLDTNPTPAAAPAPPRFHNPPPELTSVPATRQSQRAPSAPAAPPARPPVQPAAAAPAASGSTGATGVEARSRFGWGRSARASEPSEVEMGDLFAMARRDNQRGGQPRPTGGLGGLFSGRRSSAVDPPASTAPPRAPAPRPGPAAPPQGFSSPARGGGAFAIAPRSAGRYSGGRGGGGGAYEGPPQASAGHRAAPGGAMWSSGHQASRESRYSSSSTTTSTSSASSSSTATSSAISTRSSSRSSGEAGRGGGRASGRGGPRSPVTRTRTTQTQLERMAATRARNRSADSALGAAFSGRRRGNR
mmetsp:Transcript_23829/g.53757  ORF Transcript_23829/g.53757 Transcript_23829/m.53757 type:complete len:896 (+) Transcript_23829:607-3294(+)